MTLEEARTLAAAGTICGAQVSRGLDLLYRIQLLLTREVRHMSPMITACRGGDRTYKHLHTVVETLESLGVRWFTVQILSQQGEKKGGSAEAKPPVFGVM